MMDKLTTSSADSEARIEALRETYAAINRNDIPAAIEIFDPQIEWIEPSDYPEGGTTHGIADVEELHKRSLATWAEGACEPERFIVAGDKIIVVAHVALEATGPGPAARESQGKGEREAQGERRSRLARDRGATCGRPGPPYA